MRNSLRKIRKARQLTLEALGELCGYDFRTIANYETADKPLPEEFLQKVAKALKVSPEEITAAPEEFLREPSPPQKPFFDPAVLTSQQLIDLFKQQTTELDSADPERKSALLQSIHALTVEMLRRVNEERL